MSSLATLLVILPAAAQNPVKAWVQEQTLLSRPEGSIEATPVIDMNVDYSLDLGFGLFAYGAVARNFGEVFAGPTYAPTSWFQVGVAGGLQSTGQFRSAGFIWFGGDQAYATFMAELNSAEVYGFKAIAAWKPLHCLGVGGFIQTSVGVGPYLEAKLEIPVLPIMIWAAPTLFDWEAPDNLKSLFGIRVHL